MFGLCDVLQVLVKFSLSLVHLQVQPPASAMPIYDAEYRICFLLQQFTPSVFPSCLRGKRNDWVI